MLPLVPTVPCVSPEGGPRAGEGAVGAAGGARQGRAAPLLSLPGDKDSSHRSGPSGSDPRLRAPAQPTRQGLPREGLPREGLRGRLGVPAVQEELPALCCVWRT